MSVVRGEDGVARCAWGDSAPDYRPYHDDEWGRPVTDDVRLFEKLCLEGFQAGLSWLTILRKREAFRRAFAGFDFEQVAALRRRRTSSACSATPASSATAARSRRRSTTRGAPSSWSRPRARSRRSSGATSPPAPRRERRAASRATAPSSLALSKELKRRGWRFVGPTTVYAFMQAMGLVNDHLEGCDAREPALRARAELTVPR